MSVLIGFPVFTSKVTRRAGLRKTVTTLRASHRVPSGSWPEDPALARTPSAAGIHIDDGDLVRIRHVDECAAIVGVQLETLGMSRQRNAAYEGSLCRIDHGKAAGAISHHEVSGARIEPDIIGIIAEIYCADGRQFRAVEQAHRAVASARNCQYIGIRRIGDTLWIFEAFDAAGHGSRRKIDRVHCSITEFGNEQALASEIDCQVIDAAGNTLQRDRALQHERGRRFRRVPAAGRHARQRRQKDAKQRRPKDAKSSVVRTTQSSVVRRTAIDLFLVPMKLP